MVGMGEEFIIMKTWDSGNVLRWGPEGIWIEIDACSVV